MFPHLEDKSVTSPQHRIPPNTGFSPNVVDTPALVLENRLGLGCQCVQAD